MRIHSSRSYYSGYSKRYASFGISGISLLLFLLAVSSPVTGDSSDVQPETYSSSIHPDAEIFDSSYPQNVEFTVITGMEATVYADSFLSHMGANNVVFCHTTWIMAPLGGYLVDGLCDIDIEGTHYTSFRIGIGDGSEGDPDKDMFTFIAHRTRVGNENSLWYPVPGPDFQPDEDEVYPESLLEYEFLLNRKDFESLEIDFQK